eukprot:gb/GFBE01050469.1/.p1 GENE.gb/GFBE01050469.1/~~gb/GFBE01050469.1/.p1  ORF type:complete len:152 (+),score=20.79 gb/GFBE01050469.1/:1-456(+)
MDARCIASGLLGGLIGGVAVALVLRKPSSRGLTRLHTADPRMSGVVVHNGYVHVSGQVGDLQKLAASDVTAQTKQTLDKVDQLLKDAGTDKSHILEGRIWIKDIGRDFAAMNAVWNEWVDPQAKPTRFCVQSEMARPGILVEIQVLAVLPE